MNEQVETAQRGSSFARRFLRDLRDAVAGKPHEYTQGPIGRSILLLSIPMVLEMIMESVFAVADVYFVSQLDAAEAIATVGLTESVLTLIFAVAIGLSMATTAMVARRVGEKRREDAAIAAVQAIYLGVLISIPIGVAGVWFAPDILRIMGGSEEVVAVGAANVAIMVGGNVVIMLLFLINAAFRGAGDPAIAMRVLWFANGANLILDPCLIFGWGPFPEMGVTGAAVATTIGRGLGVLYQIWLLYRGNGVLQIQRRHLKPRWDVIGRLIRISVGGVFQWLIATSSWIALVRIVAIFGDAAVAGYTIGIRVIVFAILPAWGLSNAAATLVGQNLGAGQPDRASRSVWMSCGYNVVFLTSVALTFVLFAHPIVSLFTDDPDILRHGVNSLRIISYGYPFFALGMVMVQAFNGAGDTFTPTTINFFCYWLFQIPLAYGMAIFWDLGPIGVYAAVAIAESVLALVGAWVFSRGRWKSLTV